MPTIPAYTINGFTRPELHTDTAGNIILDPVAAKLRGDLRDQGALSRCAGIDTLSSRPRLLDVAVG